LPFRGVLNVCWLTNLLSSDIRTVCGGMLP
jgi:hypothetical protein